MRNKRFEPHIQHQQLLKPAPEGQAPKTCNFENQEDPPAGANLAPRSMTHLARGAWNLGSVWLRALLRPSEQPLGLTHLHLLDGCCLGWRWRVQSSQALSPGTILCCFLSLFSVPPEYQYLLGGSLDMCLLPPAAPLHGLALVASGALSCRSLRTATSRERALKGSLSPGHSQRQQIQELSLSGRGLLAHGCSLRARLLIKDIWGLTNPLHRPPSMHGFCTPETQSHHFPTHPYPLLSPMHGTQSAGNSNSEVRYTPTGATEC